RAAVVPLAERSAIPDDEGDKAQRLEPAKTTNVPAPADTSRNSQDVWNDVHSWDDDERPAPPPSADYEAVGDPVLTELPLQVSVYVLPEAIKAAHKLARVNKITYSMIAMDALDLAIERGGLKELVRSRQVVDRPEGSRFPPRRARRGTSRNTGGPTRTLWALQLTRSELAVLEELKDEVEAASRSVLVSAAVEWYLQQSHVKRDLNRQPLDTRSRLTPKSP
uniref:hypothetical protein n=1 Tax=Salinispora arenicola TaxID=168697 RepID=UPI0012FB50CA